MQFGHLHVFLIDDEDPVDRREVENMTSWRRGLFGVLKIRNLVFEKNNNSYKKGNLFSFLKLLHIYKTYVY